MRNKVPLEERCEETIFTYPFESRCSRRALWRKKHDTGLWFQYCTQHKKMNHNNYGFDGKAERIEECQ